jgi:DNA-directed RNA polymerase subunit RPC12/RpoP
MRRGLQLPAIIQGQARAKVVLLIMESQTDEKRHCWECGAHVPFPQRQHSSRVYRGIICTRCEPWVRSVLARERR